MLTDRTRATGIGIHWIVAIVLLAWPSQLFAQDLEPRRWTHQPIGTNVAGISYVYTEGELLFDPVLELEEVEVKSHNLVAAYARWFECFGQTARIDVFLPYEDARLDGLLSGTPASTDRRGFADPWVRLSYNFLGSPALKGEEYMQYRANHQTNTVAGAAVAVMLPLGEYDEQKLINLGQNRFIIRPQIGAVHTRGAWSHELTGSAFLFTDNDEFFGGHKREQETSYALQAHFVRTFPSRWWASASAGYSWAGTSRVDGVRLDDSQSKFLYALSLGFPIAKQQALKFVYLHGDSRRLVGTDTDGLAVSWSTRF